MTTITIIYLLFIGMCIFMAGINGFYSLLREGYPSFVNKEEAKKADKHSWIWLIISIILFVIGLIFYLIKCWFYGYC